MMADGAIEEAPVDHLPQVKKAVKTGGRNAERSAGLFFGYFLWTGKESHPAAGRDRRTLDF